MNSSKVILWAAPAAMLGGALSILFAFVGENSWAHVPLDAAGYALLVVGIAGLYLYLRRSRGFGRLGTVGFYVCIFVFAMVAILDVGMIVNEEVERLYLALGPLRGPMLLLGLLFFGVATLRARKPSRGGAWLLIGATVTNVLGILAMIASGGMAGAWIFILPTVLFGLGWAWLGYGLWSHQDEWTQQPARVG